MQANLKKSYMKTVTMRVSGIINQGIQSLEVINDGTCATLEE